MCQVRGIPKVGVGRFMLTKHCPTLRIAHIRDSINGIVGAGSWRRCRLCLVTPGFPGSLETVAVAMLVLGRERILDWQPTGPNPLYHRDDLVDRPRAMGG